MDDFYLSNLQNSIDFLKSKKNRHSESDPSQSVVTARKSLKRGREDPNGLQTPSPMSQGHMEAPHTP